MESDLARHLQSQSETKQKDKINLRKRKVQRSRYTRANLGFFKNDESEEAKTPMAIEEEEEERGRERRSELSPPASSNYLSRSENAIWCLYERQRDSWRKIIWKRKNEVWVSEWSVVALNLNLRDEQWVMSEECKKKDKVCVCVWVVVWSAKETKLLTLNTLL